MNPIEIISTEYIKENSKGTFYFSDKELKVRHRENDLPAMEYKNGVKAWFVNGKRHRINGPAYQCTETQYNEWWINGIEYTRYQFDEYIKSTVKQNQSSAFFPK